MAGDVALIVTAAGEGSRMGADVRKPFLEICGAPVLHRTLERFTRVEGIFQTILALHPEDYERREEILSAARPLGATDASPGGSCRSETVENALGAVSERAGIVLIHDAVRPFVSAGVVEGVIEAARRSGAAIAAARPADTVKRAEGVAVVETLPREALFLVQTPQGFRAEVIKRAYARRAGREFTDDAALVEEAGGRVEVVESGRLNFKITTVEDLELARAVFGAARTGRLQF